MLYPQIKDHKYEGWRPLEGRGPLLEKYVVITDIKTDEISEKISKLNFIILSLLSDDWISMIIPFITNEYIILNDIEYSHGNMQLIWNWYAILMQ